MTNYMFVYSGGHGVSADEAERKAQYAKWGQWFGELGSAVVDGGAATGTAKTVGPGGEGLPGPRDQRSGRRLRSDRDVAGARGRRVGEDLKFRTRPGAPRDRPARRRPLLTRQFMCLSIWASLVHSVPRPIVIRKCLTSRVSFCAFVVRLIDTARILQSECATDLTRD
jgi:hypothetical protein